MLAAGDRVGPYEVLSPLGSGGMGHVYRARDARLKRDVALKVVLDDVAADPDRLARFQREAELLATLNHPNIAAIYGMEGAALVLELIDGPTLADRIAQGPMPLGEALPILGQIIDALDYAHEKGIVHRDLKPANIKLTSEGSVKLLDFGLAKALGSDAPSGDPRLSPTITARATMAGTILGTAAYMAPEQARGLAIDKRADIWAFGVVTYELNTGKAPFEGPTISDTLALVLTKDPDYTSVSDRVRSLVRRCLERDPRNRLRDIGDARILLDGSVDRDRPTPRARGGLTIALGALALVAAIAAGVLLWRDARQRPVAATPVRFEIPTDVGRTLALSVSPDGRMLAFISAKDGLIHVRGLDSWQTRTVADSVASEPPIAWSPDSRFIAFVTAGRMKKIDVTGGQPVETLAASGRVVSASWTRDGTILVSGRDGVARIPVSGAAATKVLPGGSSILAAQVLPGGRHILFSAGERYVLGTTVGIFAGSLDAITSLESTWKTSKALATTDSPEFVVTSSPDGRRGHLLFVRDGTLSAQGVDLTSLEPLGAPAILAADVGLFAASNDVLVYRAGAFRLGSQLRWLDSRGKELARLGESGNYGNVLLSADGKTVVVDRVDSGVNHLWVGDVTRGVLSRLSSDDANETPGALAPDGTVVFTASARGIDATSAALSSASGDLYAIRRNSSAPELLMTSSFVKHGNSISPDSKYLLYDEHGAERQNLFVLPLTGPRPKPIPFVVTSADETFAQFSPDGKWVAYSSDDSGRREVYVRAFLPDQNPASGARKWLVSTAGGEKPRWSRDGKQLFYIDLNRRMMATPVTLGASFEPGLPTALFDARFMGFVPYDVSPDGRFLINTPIAATGETQVPISVVLNWAAALNK